MTDIQAAACNHGAVLHALPGWGADDQFVCRLRRPGLVNLVSAAGFVPNPLLAAVEEMFFPSEKQPRLPIDQQARALEAIARYAMVEPTFDELTDAGLELTDEQFLAIYAFALKGADGLARFRDAMRGAPGGHGDDIPHKAVLPDGHG
jgi:hypothetical protein